MNEPLNLFISYSHEDKEHLKKLKKHLASLKRSRTISEWTDQELIVGDRLDKEILQHLTKADIVVFLISVDFLDSWYAYEKELLETIKRLDDYTLRIIPIIVRQCDWKDAVLCESSYVPESDEAVETLGTFLAIPQDGKPISSFSNEDEAWTSVIMEIKKVIAKIHEVRSKKKLVPIEPKMIEENHTSSLLSPVFRNKLGSTEIVFQHRHKDDISLSDLFVYPDLKMLREEPVDMKILSSEQLSDYKQLATKTVLFGDGQIGKSSLIKQLYQSYIKLGIYTLLVNGQDVVSGDAKRLLSTSVEKQYVELDFKSFCEKQTVLFVDDFHLCKLNEQYKQKFLENVEHCFSKVVIVADTNLKYDESDYFNFSTYSRYEILLFNRVRRGELINKWNSLGRQETIDMKELHTQNDVLTHHIDAIFRKNIVPSKPIYILLILQSLEAVKPGDYGLTSYGHCYQYLIQQSLQKVSVRGRELDSYINYLTEIASYIYHQGKMNITEEQLVDFQKTYSAKFLINSHDEVIGILHEAGILKTDNGKVEFGYRYIFYFYVAKYLAEHLEEVDYTDIVCVLCQKLHIEKNANILIFLLHHSKKQSIIDDILLHTWDIFYGINEARLDLNDTKALVELISSVPKIVLKQRNVEEERKKHLEMQDKIDKNTVSYCSNKRAYEEEELNSTNLEERGAIWVQISQSIKSIEIIGQILRNRYGSLTREQLIDLAKSAQNVGLRFLKTSLDWFDIAEKESVDYISKLIGEGDNSNKNITKIARRFYLTICYLTCFGIIQKIADSLGYEDLVPIFEKLSQSTPLSPAIKLIDISIKLEFTKHIPKKEISSLFQELDNNIVARRMLQEIVLQHLYLHSVNYQDRQWLSNTLELSDKSVLRMQQKHKRG